MEIFDKEVLNAFFTLREGIAADPIEISIMLVAGLLLRNIFGDELSAIPMALQKLPMHSKE